MKIRILAFILAALCVLPLVCSCADSTENPEVTTDPSETTTVSGDIGGEVTTEKLFVDDDLGTMNLDTKVTFLYWNDVERHEFFITDDQITGDPVDDALISRNAAVEERLGVELEWIGKPGNYNNQKAFVADCQTGNVDGLYDVFAGYSLTAATIAMQGYSQDISQLEHLNFSKPWWPASLIGQATINDKLYFASGDISTNMLHMMNVFLFNKDMLTDLGLDKENDPYELVASNEWTIKAMMRMCQNAYDDSGTNIGKKDEGDKFGFVSTDINYDSLYIGCGLKTIESGAEGLYVSPDFGSDAAIELAELCVTFLEEDYAWGKSVVNTDVPASRIFAEGRALFISDRAYITTSATMRDYGDTLDYGVVPNPKLNKSQKDYVTMLAFPFTLYSISSASKNPEAAAAVLECMGSEGYRKVTPELFETVMKVKYTHDSTTAYMYDLIKANVYIDLGRIFSTELDNVTYKLFRDRLRTGANNYATQYATVEQKLSGENGKLAAINSKFFD